MLYLMVALQSYTYDIYKVTIIWGLFSFTTTTTTTTTTTIINVFNIPGAVGEEESSHQCHGSMKHFL